MIRLFVRHEVKDYDTWLKAYHDFGGERQEFGVVGATLGRSIDNPNDVTVTHDFGSLDEAKSFMSSPRLKEAMEAAGVSGIPTIWFTEVV